MTEQDERDAFNAQVACEFSTQAERDAARVGWERRAEVAETAFSALAGIYVCHSCRSPVGERHEDRCQYSPYMRTNREKFEEERPWIGQLWRR
jgi:hypothetical protein